MSGKTIICVQCDQEFEFSSAEQKLFAKKGFDEPKRCPECRHKKRSNSSGTEEGIKSESRRKRRREWERRRNPKDIDTYYSGYSE